MDNTNSNPAAAPRKFRKGDTVIMFSQWSKEGNYTPSHLARFPDLTNKEVFSFRVCMVTSWGKKQATLVDAVTAEPIKCRVYDGLANHIFAGDSAESGREWIAETMATSVRNLRKRVAREIAENDTHPVQVERIARETAAAETLERGEYRLAPLAELMGLFFGSA